ncbi:hypothetical protein HYU11_03110 [Candidatus Woesearchaeota archaeon]|nr:hypothetical protein [Candidatus Woesearchaeota archaeon]
MKLAILAIMAVLLGCAQKAADTDYSGATISFKTHSGFVPEDAAVQILRVEPGRSVYELQASNGTTMLVREKILPEEKYNQLVESLEKAKFMSLKEKLEVDARVTDVGIAEIEVELKNGTSKKVVIDPYYVDELSPEIRELNQNLLGMISFSRSITKEQAEQLAEQWIRQAPTFKFDGEGLELIGHEVLESFPEQHVLEYSFTSRHGGYGDRTGKFITQVITPHKIKLRIVEDSVISAVIDEKWDEMSQKMIS